MSAEGTGKDTFPNTDKKEATSNSTGKGTFPNINEKETCWEANLHCSGNNKKDTKRGYHSTTIAV